MPYIGFRGRRVGAPIWSNPLSHSGHIRHNVPVSTGKRAGSRRGAPQPRPLNKGALVIGVAITLSVIAWGYLVYAAIDFGTAARGGSGSTAWAFMALACLGAVACLFVGLLLVARLMLALGVAAPSSDSPAVPRPVGGKRAAR